MCVKIRTYILKEAAEHLDSGTRSFPVTSEGGFMQHYAYNILGQFRTSSPTNSTSFFPQAAVSSLQRDALFYPYSAGYVCKPLLRETLASDSLTADGWEKLVGAARDLADESTQRPRDSPLPSTKRPTPSAPPLPSKRQRVGTESPSPASPSPSERSPARSGYCTVTNNNRRAERARN
ncbi:hypothetical protein GQ44DRAFT_744914 [Phaeosphaeriaceae sp. PMI808]|nr:hypothetical protein GQ44DRAFT_744914 [Phaeosphaeriaceae sp. PMI808]